MLGVWSKAIAAPATAGAVFLLLTETHGSGALPELRPFWQRRKRLTFEEDSDTISEVVTAPH